MLLPRMRVFLAIPMVLGSLWLLVSVIRMHSKPIVPTFAAKLETDLIRNVKNQFYTTQFYTTQQRLQHNQSQGNEALNDSYFDSNTGNTSSLLAQTPPPVCPLEPPNLAHQVLIDVEITVDIEDAVINNPQLQLGGFYSPPNCQPRDKVAVIIPFRDRYAHLHIFLHYMIPILCRQLLQFRIYVIEQAGNCSFNRGMLLNVGALEATKDNDWQCYCFHDVDLIMEDDRNLYTCPDNPKHLSVAIDKFDYKLSYPQLFGGIVIFSKEQFQKVNGYSNKYWGWGAEDDDAYKRVVYSGMKVIRPDKSIARYKMIRGIHHTHGKPNPARFNLLARATSRMKTDGLNTTSMLYEVADKQLHRLYTKIVVELKNHVNC